MPYAPTVNFDAGILGRGIADAGRSILAATDANAEDAARRDAQERQMEMERARLAQALGFHTADQQMEGTRLLANMTDRAADRAVTVQANTDTKQHRADALQWDKDSTQPVGLEVKGLGTGFIIPKTGQVKITAPEPGASGVQPDGTIVKDASGNELGVWVGGKFQQDKFTAVTDPKTMGSSLVNQRTGQPHAAAAPAASSAPAASQYQPGKVYPGANGTAARYNADGSWTRVK